MGLEKKYIVPPNQVPFYEAQHTIPFTKDTKCYLKTIVFPDSS